MQVQQADNNYGLTDAMELTPSVVSISSEQKHANGNSLLLTDKKQLDSEPRLREEMGHQYQSNDSIMNPKISVGPGGINALELAIDER